MENSPARPVELSLAAIGLGILLSIVMGAANVYLGLRAGMTVSASIPAAVVSLGILRGLMGRTSILESNLVQTAASAGESLAAGIIFTMPALILTGVWNDGFEYWTTTLVALTGGLLGILLMIPMRKVFVVDSKELKYPEGVACAEVLRSGGAASGSQAESGLFMILAGIGVGGVFKLLQGTFGLFRSAAETAYLAGGRVLYAGTEISPALFSVGYIVTLPIALQIFAGGFIGWTVAMPLLGTEGITPGDPVDMAYGIWSTQVRYLGVGAMIVGGIASIWRVRAGLVAAVEQMLHIFSISADQEVEETERNLTGRTILIWTVVTVATITAMYYQMLHHAIELTLITTVAMLVMSFFFAAVASYIVGLVGNSNSPVSGMTITAVLGTGVLIWLFGFTGDDAILATLGVAGIVCCVACTSGDVCNDLKTGHLVGASPRNQQIMQILGVVVAAFFLCPVMTVLHEGSLKAGTGGIGGEELAAPQAAIFAALVKGFFGDGVLPKDMIAWGAGVGVALLIADKLLAAAGSTFRLHVMPVAVGIYLPFGLAVPILLGGVVRYLVDRRDAPGTDTFAQRGVLITSGLIAGESLMGVLVGLLAFLEFSGWKWGADLVTQLGMSEEAGNTLLQWLSLAALTAVAAWLYLRSTKKSS